MQEGLKMGWLYLLSGPVISIGAIFESKDALPRGSRMLTFFIGAAFFGIGVLCIDPVTLGNIAEYVIPSALL